MSDREFEEADSTDDALTDVSEFTTTPVADNWKLKAEDSLDNDPAGLFQNNASSGTPKGIEIALPNTEDGWSIFSKDDGYLEGMLKVLELCAIVGFVLRLCTEGADLIMDTGDTDDVFPGNIVGGHQENDVLDGARGGVIGGGGASDGGDFHQPNEVNDHFGAIGGGRDNVVGSPLDDDPSTAMDATVGGGLNNRAKAGGSTVGGGTGNTADGQSATVAGGENNDAFGIGATVGGGVGNIADGTASTIFGGEANKADGDWSACGGRLAKANGHAGAIVFGDSSSTAVQAQNDDEVRFQAGGGIVQEHGDYELQNGSVKVGDGNGIKDGNGNSRFAFPTGGPVELEADLTVTSGASVSAQTTSNSLDFDVNDHLIIEAATVADGSATSKEMRFWGTEGESGDIVNIELSPGSNGGVIFDGLNTGSGDPVEIDTSTGEIYRGSSSARYKTNIEPLATDTDTVLDLEPRSFEFVDSGQEDVGLIAEEVEEVLPEVVTYDEEGRPEAVRYDRLGVFLAPEVRKNRDRQDDLRADIDDVNAQIEKQIDRIEELERETARIDDLERENEQLRGELASKNDRIDELGRRLAALEAQAGTADAPTDD